MRDIICHVPCHTIDSKTQKKHGKNTIFTEKNTEKHDFRKMRIRVTLDEFRELPPKARRRRRLTTKSSDHEVVRPRSGPTPKASDDEVVYSKSRFRRRFVVEIRRKIAIWKAESLTNSISKELASDDITISTYDDFESDHFVVGRLRRRTSSWSDAFGEPRIRGNDGRRCFSEIDRRRRCF